jgi:hypothetical protein
VKGGHGRGRGKSLTIGLIGKIHRDFRSACWKFETRV